MYFVSICTMSPGSEILIPRGNRALGCFADRLRFLDIFLSINPLRFMILPMVLGEIQMPSRESNDWILYFDHAGYCLRKLTTRSTVSGFVIGTRMRLGL